jgi:hypothetical protein
MSKKCIACPRQLFDHPAYLAAGQPRRDAMVLFCWVILRHGGFDERFVQIGYGAFGQFFPVRYLKEFRKALADLVNCDEIFSYRLEGQEKCLGYRFARHLSKQDFVEVELKSDRRHKLDRKPQVVLDPWFKQHNLTLPVHHKLAECFDLFQLDESRLQEVLSALDVDKRVAAEHQAEHWLAQQYFITVADTRRIYSSAANMKRELRRILKVGGEAVAEIDVSCCQPYLLSYFLKDVIPQSEFQIYRQLTESGSLYGEISHDLGRQRDSVKLATVQWLCGSWFEESPFGNTTSGNVSTEDEELELAVLEELHGWFKRRFPSVCEYMRSEKTNRDYYKIFNTITRQQQGKTTQPYAIIAHRLQRLEAEIVIEHCCAALFVQHPQFPILTAHDALIVPVSKVEQALAQMKNSFREFGLCPKIAVKGTQDNSDKSNGERAAETYKPVDSPVAYRAIAAVVS